MTMTRSQAERRVVDFLAEKLGASTTIDPDQDLIDNRMITSMGFMNFVLLLEEVTETPIPMEDMNVEDFRTLARIRAKFLSVLSDDSESSIHHNEEDAHV